MQRPQKGEFVYTAGESFTDKSGRRTRHMRRRCIELVTERGITLGGMEQQDATGQWQRLGGMFGMRSAMTWEQFTAMDYQRKQA